MTWIIIAMAAGVMLALALIMTFVLGWANEAFHVAIDPRIEKVNEALPGANCGGCGYVGCGEYAEAVVLGEGKVPLDICPVGGEGVATDIAEILGMTLEKTYPYRPVVHCAAHTNDRLGRHEYRGEQTCATANLVAGVQGCIYGCLTLGDCVESCKFDAIHLIDGKITVDYEKCVGCGACEKVCPRKVISMVPFKDEQMFVLACSNQDFGKDVKSVCKIGCIGCKVCEKLSNGLFAMRGNLPHIDYDNYNPEGVDTLMDAVLDKCPAKSIVKIGKPSSADIEAVAGEDVPDIVKAKFETTVDKTEWHG